MTRGSARCLQTVRVVPVLPQQTRGRGNACPDGSGLSALDQATWSHDFIGQAPPRRVHGTPQGLCRLRRAGSPGRSGRHLPGPCRCIRGLAGIVRLVQPRGDAGRATSNLPCRAWPPSPPRRPRAAAIRLAAIPGVPGWQARMTSPRGICRPWHNSLPGMRTRLPAVPKGSSAARPIQAVLAQAAMDGKSKEITGRRSIQCTRHPDASVRLPPNGLVAALH